MRLQIAEAATEAGQNWIAYLMAGLGFHTMEFSQLLGGLFFAIAAGSIVGRARRDPRKVWFIIGMAAFSGLVAALIWPHLGWQYPVQLGMAAAGAASSWIVNIFVKVGDGVEARADVIADRAIDRVLPDKGDNK